MIKRIEQLVGHCGPAVISMLASRYEYSIDQSALAKASGVAATIAEHGSRVDELAAGLRSMFPSLALFGRYNCTVDDLCVILEEFGPVGLELQVTFTPRDGGEPFRVGHYVVAVSHDRQRDRIEIVDPDATSELRRGWISSSQLTTDWWEVNRFVMPDSTIELRGSYGLVFGVTKSDISDSPFPYGASEVSAAYVLAHTSSVGRFGEER